MVWGASPNKTLVQNFRNQNPNSKQFREAKKKTILKMRLLLWHLYIRRVPVRPQNSSSSFTHTRRTKSQTSERRRFAEEAPKQGPNAVLHQQIAIPVWMGNWDLGSMGYTTKTHITPIVKHCLCTVDFWFVQIVWMPTLQLTDISVTLNLILNFCSNAIPIGQSPNLCKNRVLRRLGGHFELEVEVNWTKTA